MRNPGRTRLFRAFNTRPARRLCGRLSNWQVVPVAFILFVSSGAVRADPWDFSYRSGVAAFELGRFDDARQRLDVALTTSNLDAHDVRRAEICAALASAYQALGEPIKAEIQFRAAEAINESRPDAQSALRVDVLSRNRPVTARSKTDRRSAAIARTGTPGEQRSIWRSEFDDSNGDCPPGPLLQRRGEAARR